MYLSPGYKWYDDNVSVTSPPERIIYAIFLGGGEFTFENYCAKNKEAYLFYSKGSNKKIAIFYANSDNQTI